MLRLFRLAVSRKIGWIKTHLPHLEPLLLLFSGFQDLERAQEALVNAHHGARIVEFSAVVWRTEQGHQLTLAEEFVAILDDLMRTTDEVHVVFLQESCDHVRAKCERHTAIVF